MTGYRIDIAADADGLTAVVRRGTAVLRTVTAPIDGEVDAVPRALAELRRQVDAAVGSDTAGTQVRLALLPPLVEARLLALPPVRAAEAAVVVRRDAGRHFLGITAPRVTAVSMPRRASGAPALAAAASAQQVHELSAAVERAGWRVTAVVAAYGAWVAAARRAGRGVNAIIAVHAGAAHVLQLVDGTPVSLRRLPADTLDELVDAAGSDVGGIALFAPDTARDALAQRLAARGWQVHPLRRSAAEAAALHAGESRLALVTDTALQHRRQSQNRLAARLAAAAVILLVASAVVALWGAQRQLDAVRAERAAIRPQVQPLLLLRDSLDELRARSSAVAAVAQRAPRWTWALHDIALMLPSEAHVTRLHATGDTITIEAEGTGAGTALQALRGAPSLTGARLVGVVDRELADGETAMERFRITARLAPRRLP
jgi:hypothetical protein